MWKSEIVASLEKKQVFKKKGGKSPEASVSGLA